MELYVIVTYAVMACKILQMDSAMPHVCLLSIPLKQVHYSEMLDFQVIGFNLELTTIVLFKT